MRSATAAAAPSTTPDRIDLHGRWQRSIGGRPIDTVPVPGGYPACGACELATTFARPAGWTTGRFFLVTEGVLARAAFTLNGLALGEAGPWARYRFEIPAAALREVNAVGAAMTDLSELFGPVPGRRFEGGLFRDLRIERRPATFIADATFRSRLSPERDRAECEVAVEFDGAEALTAEVRLVEAVGGRLVATARASAGQTARFTLERPALWSPDHPACYRCEVVLANGDTWSDVVGFRDLVVDGRDFRLNGERLVLKGVCRHEFMYPWGYAPPLDEVRRELARIRHAGFNYVRLVHSPQHPAIPRLASELGLLISEEPGTCWQDLDDETVAAPAVEVLRRTVRRDRNCPAILAWYISNECHASIPYATRVARMCRELDPGRLLSYADCFGPEDKVRAMTEQAGLSFYGINQYTYWPGEFVKRMDAYVDKPLVFTEWGGGMAQGNARVLGDLIAMFIRATRPGAPHRIAGHAFWAWADYEEYNRPGPCAIAGWTREGLIDDQRRAKPDLATLSQMCFDIDHPEPPPRPVAECVLPAMPRAGAWREVDLETVAVDPAPEAALAKRRAAYGGIAPVIGRIEAGGIAFAGRGGTGPARPLLLGEGADRLVIPVDRTIRGLAVLGHVALHRAYPASTLNSVWYPDAEGAAVLGERAGAYELVFADGIERVELVHGVNILRGNALMRWWKTAPRSAETLPALQAVVDPSFEHWRADLWERRFDRPRHLREIRWSLADAKTILALYALSVETA